MAAMVMLLAVTVPHHHHHDGGFCTEAAEHAGDENGRDTEKHHGYCVAESEFTDRTDRDDDTVDCGRADCDHAGHIHLFPVIYHSQTVFPDESGVDTDFGEYIVHYRSVAVRPWCGLRAPPVILC